MISFFKKTLHKIQRLARPQAENKPIGPKKIPPGQTAAPGTDSGRPRPDTEGRSYQRRPSGKQSRKKRRGQTAPEAVADGAMQANWSMTRFKVPPAEGKTRFHDFDLPEPLMHAIHDLGFTYCTPIQAEMLPSTLSGQDGLGRAQTGTGKTAAFLITVITRILNHPIQDKRQPGTPRILVVAPTRELVLQISEEARQLSKYCGLKIISVFGGMDYERQRKQLAAGAADIIVATPGRLLDFQRRRDISLKKIEALIIDEADRMLDMGFIPDMRKIIYSTPPKEKRQTMLFSATLTREVARLAAQWTRQPAMVEIEPEQVAVDTVEQIVYITTTEEKFALLYNIIVCQELDRVLVFCNRRDEVRRLSEMLTRHGIDCSMLSGDVHQKKRVLRLDRFKAGKIRVLVATDVAGRGIHIEGMDHVVNFTLPRDPEDYVHRIGRTGRAGASGTSVSFADEEDAFYIPAIEEFMDRELPCTEPPEKWLVMPEAAPVKKKRRSRRKKTAAPQNQGETHPDQKARRRPRRRPRKRSPNKTAAAKPS